jgi:hypothetical protein
LPVALGEGDFHDRAVGGRCERGRIRHIDGASGCIARLPQSPRTGLPAHVAAFIRAGSRHTFVNEFVAIVICVVADFG